MSLTCQQVRASHLLVAALVGVHHQGGLAVLPPHIIWRGIKFEVELLKGVELEGSNDTHDLVLTVNVLHVLVKLLQGRTEIDLRLSCILQDSADGSCEDEDSVGGPSAGSHLLLMEAASDRVSLIMTADIACLQQRLLFRCR